MKNKVGNKRKRELGTNGGLMMRLADIDLTQRLNRAEYQEKLSQLQLAHLQYQAMMIEKDVAIIMVFEGWDASGKGGAIKRITEKLDPRTYEVHPIGAPTPIELQHHYMRRFWVRLPRHGQMALFDRSWYGRVLVERVEKLCEKEAWRRAYREINEFERLLLDDKTLLLKFFLHISPEEQLKRFKDREENPYKRWKITSEDWRNRDKWAEYHKAIDEMLEKTHTATAPWYLIPFEDKKYGRIRIMEIILQRYKRFFKYVL
ncbi:polyphosphate kinase 2 family protein [Heliorestis convoluta]|uniref:Putative UDP-galactose-lipid carrier transferase n=1 Tax=Heliorestis convoluta TaxID=356322 RepID=A0A5Q2N5S5_9FIRM|nr:UDP-galactose-lipid carrier transferase [Heliorestis convoluta]QGG47600.1 putative UDP-galactose-lipid carrier transferase [Heliorestis convoluta]